MKRRRYIPTISFKRPSPDKIIKFYNDGTTFSAKYKAEAWLHERGYSYGSSTACCPYIAIQKGEYTLPQKIHNFNKEDINMIDAVLYSLDYRDGEVEIWVMNAT